eukprot:Lankesteria_metandrocarpae@DN4151_c0_g1_i1.p1
MRICGAVAAAVGVLCTHGQTFEKSSGRVFFSPLLFANNQQPATKSEHVVELNKDNLDSFIEQEEAVLVLYYAPWCFWSTQLVPNFNTAADMLAHHHTHVKLAKIDASSHVEVRQKHRIAHFPTLKMYIDGEEHSYAGGRYHSQIVTWVSEVLNSEITLSTIASLDATMKAHVKDFMVIGGFGKDSAHEQKENGDNMLKQEGDHHVEPTTPGGMFVKLSRHFTDIFFADVSEGEVTNRLQTEYGFPSGLNAPFVAVVNPFSGNDVSSLGITHLFDHIFSTQPRVVKYSEDLLHRKNLTEFIRSHSFPIVVPLTAPAFEHVFADGRPLLTLFVDPADPKSPEYISALLPAAIKFRQTVIFCVSFQKEVLDVRLMKMLGAEDEPLPTFRVVTMNPTGDHAWSPLLKFKPSEELSKSMLSDEIIKFIAAYFEDKLAPDLASEPIVAEAENSGFVRRVIGLTYAKEVLKSKEDIFIVFQAPWCGHCRKLEPTLLEVGKRLSRLNTIKVMKMDATQNEVPGLQLRGYPALFLFPSGKKHLDPIFLAPSGERTVQSLIDFIHDAATTKFDKKLIMSAELPGEATPLLQHEPSRYAYEL